MSSGLGRMINKSSMEATSSSPTIRVEIYNQTYNIRSDGDTEYIIQLAEFVDSRMREISSGTLSSSLRHVSASALVDARVWRLPVLSEHEQHRDPRRERPHRGGGERCSPG